MARRTGRRTPPRPFIPVHSTPSSAPNILSDIDVETWLETGQWASVRSSNVSAICYDSAALRLGVSFNSGGGGWYNQVDDYIASEMFGASSMGKFVHQRLKNKYSYSKF